MTVRAAKQALRERCWEALREAGAARFPGTRGRIPNFVGAERAAERLAESEEFEKAGAIKCNPDAPQRPVRRAALKAGKVLYVAVPRLRDERPFLELDPERLDASELWRATSIRGAAELGRPVSAEEVRPIDLIVTGCVAVTRRGGRLGKGGGYSDLEYALLRELDLAREETPIATTVHSSQIVAAEELPMTSHDISLDLIATEAQLIRCRRRPPRPSGVLWDELDEEKRAAIPALGRRT